MSDAVNRSFIRHGMAKWGLFMGLLFVFWFGGWFVFANFADRKVAESLVRIEDRGINVVCDNRTMRGFPFRIGVHCDRVNVASKRDTFRIEAGAVRTAAQLYAPGEFVAEIDGPLRSWPGGVETTATWKQMRLFADAHLTGGFDLISLNFAEIEVLSQQIEAAVGTGALHLRPSPENPDTGRASFQAMDIAGDFTGVSSVLQNGLQVPPADLGFDFTLEDGYRDIVLARRPLRQIVADGGNLVIRSAVLAVPNGGLLGFSGPVELHDDGTISGKIRIGIAEPKAVLAWAGVVDSKLTQLATGVGQAVAGMGKETNFGPQKMRSISVKIERGSVRLGFIEIARIAPLVLN